MTADTAWLLVFRYTEAAYGKKANKSKSIFGKILKLKILQKYTKNNPIWLKFNLKSFQTSTNQMRKKKIQKISFFWHDPFSGYADKPKKVQIANRHAKIIIKMYFKHYFYISYGITHSVCGILLPK